MMKIVRVIQLRPIAFMRACTSAGVRLAATVPLHGLLTSLLTAPPARPLDQIHGKVGVAQLGDEVGRDGFPGASFSVPDHVVVSTILHARNIVLVGHHGAS